MTAPTQNNEQAPEALASCPFCNAKLVPHSEIFEHKRTARHTAGELDSHGAMTCPTEGCPCSFVCIFTDDPAEVAAWNRRVPAPPPIPGKVAELVPVAEDPVFQAAVALVHTLYRTMGEPPSAERIATDAAMRMIEDASTSGDGYGSYDVEGQVLAQAFAAAIEALTADKLAVEKERDEARLLVTEANNSLYGSQGYFHSLNGGAFDKYHLANGIEKLKGQARAEYRATTAAESRIAVLEAEVEKLRGVRDAAAVYFRRYCQDEASDGICCISDEQHEDAKALRSALTDPGLYSDAGKAALQRSQGKP